MSRFLRRPSLLALFALALVALLTTAESHAIPRYKRPDTELINLYKHARDTYNEHKDLDEGLRLYGELESRAIAKQDSYWEATAIWSKAQLIGNHGDNPASLALYEKSLAVFSRSPDFPGTANHLILLGNLVSVTQDEGRPGESLRYFHDLYKATGLNLAGTSRFPSDTPLFELTDDELAEVTNIAFISIVFVIETNFRFQAGDDTRARELAEKIDRRLRGSTRLRDVARHARALETLAQIHLAAGRAADAEQVLVRLIDLGKLGRSDASDEIIAARCELALLRARRGDETAPLFAEARAAIEEARFHHWIDLALACTGQLARLHAATGDLPSALALIDSSLAETRTLKEPHLLAELLLARAEIRLDAGRPDEARADLIEALKWFRDCGGLRAEAGAHVLNARALRLAGKPLAARQALADAETWLRRFPDVRLRALLDRETPLIAAMRDDSAPPQAPSPVAAASLAKSSDLQPVEQSTTTPDGWSARGRFTLTNPGLLNETGWLSAKGVSLRSRWDAAALVWHIDATEAGPENEVRQQVTLRPLDQATVVLTIAPALAKSGAVELTWRGRAASQTAWWRYAGGPLEADRTVIDTNLALENPFYSVPLHHHVVRRLDEGGGSQNLRVSSSAPCRIELVNPETGRVFAVDATGDGDFRGGGDIVVTDGNLDGIPDLRFDQGQRVATLELQVYPQARYEQVEIKLEVQQRDGTWILGATDRLLGKE